MKKSLCLLLIIEGIFSFYLFLGSLSYAFAKEYFVPSFTGLLLEEAMEKIDRIEGLDLDENIIWEDSNLPYKTVIFQSPAKGDRYDPGDFVTLKVAIPYSLPNLTMKTKKFLDYLHLPIEKFNFILRGDLSGKNIKRTNQPDKISTYQLTYFVYAFSPYYELITGPLKDSVEKSANDFYQARELAEIELHSRIAEALYKEFTPYRLLQEIPLEFSIFTLCEKLLPLLEEYRRPGNMFYIEPISHPNWPFLANYVRHTMSDCLTYMGFYVIEFQNRKAGCTINYQINYSNNNYIISAGILNRITDPNISQSKMNITIEDQNISRNLQQQLTPQGSLVFRVNFLHYQEGKLTPEPINDGDTLYSGDYYLIYFEPDQRSYVYIYQIDSSGKLQQLFPMERYKDIVLNNKNPVEPGITYPIPSPKYWFKLDKTVGKEIIYFIASTHPLPHIENAYEAIIQATASKGTTMAFEFNRTMSPGIKTRGMETIEMIPFNRNINIPPIPSREQETRVYLSDFEQKLRGTQGSFVRTLWFHHLDPGTQD